MLKNSKSVVVPFKYCSIERASRFLTEVLEQSIETEDLHNFLKQGIVRGCVNFGSVIDLDVYKNMHLIANMESAEFVNAIDFDNQMEERLNDFLRAYSKTQNGEFTDGILPWLWNSDQAVSQIAPPIVSEDAPYYWTVENEGIDGIFVETPVTALGLWEIKAETLNNVYDIVFSHGKAEHDKLYSISFGRIPETKYRWHGYIDEYKLEVENIVLLDEDLKALIKLFDDTIDVKLLIRPSVQDVYSQRIDVAKFTEGTGFSRSRSPSKQLKDIFKAMVCIHPELGSECLSEPYALYEKLAHIFASKGVPLPIISSRSVGDYIRDASWSHNQIEK